MLVEDFEAEINTGWLAFARVRVVLMWKHRANPAQYSDIASYLLELVMQRPSELQLALERSQQLFILSVPGGIRFMLRDPMRATVVELNICQRASTLRLCRVEVAD